MLWTEKYRPKSIDAMVGNDEKRDRIKKWLLDFLNGKKRKPLLIYGPPGVGKTALAYALAEQFNLDVIELSASDIRNKKRVERVLKGTTLASSLFSRGKILLIDDVDIIIGKKDSGAVSAFKEVIALSEYPLIITANNIWDKKIAPIRNECEKVELKRVNKSALKRFLMKIAEKEGVDAAFVEQVVANAEGDVRAAINDLQAMHVSERLREKDIFHLVKDVFKARTYEEVRSAIYYAVDYDLLFWWIEENIPLEYEDRDEVKRAFNYLSKSDIFNRRTKESWKMLKYALDLAFVGTALSKKRAYHKFTPYRFPSYLRIMSSTVQRRAMRKRIGKKLAHRLHCNSREVWEDMAVVSRLIASDVEKSTSFYELSEEEVAFILSVPLSQLKKIR